jgi:hypothetical protein
MPETVLGFGFDLNGLDHLFDTTSGVVTSPRLPMGYSPGFYRRCETYPAYGDALRVGDRVIIGVGPKDVCAPPRTFSAPAVVGGDGTFRLAGDVDYVASLSGLAVWLVHSPVHGLQAATEVNPDTGAILHGPIDIGRRQRVFSAVRGGLLAIRTDRWPRSTVDVISTTSGRVTRTITRSADRVLDARGDIVAWQGPGDCGPCQIHVTNLRTDTTIAMHWAAPQRYLCDNGALSPDARWLAIQYGCPRPDYQGTSPIVLVNTATGDGRIVPGSAQSQTGNVVWSANGHWLIWEDDFRRALLRAYRIGTRRPYAFRAPAQITSELLEAFPVP